MIGKIKNIEKHLKNKRIEFYKADLEDSSLTKKVIKGQEFVFHLAADHGGRGYVDLHQAGPATNLLLDGNVFWQALKARVKKIISSIYFASFRKVFP